MYQVVIDRYAQRQLEKISPPHFNRLIKAIHNLSDDPRPPGCKKLTASPGYRIRVGDYRIIYTTEDKILKVFVIDIGHRREIYD
jgi:mRNA interferase RelE/StbE